MALSMTGFGRHGEIWNGRDISVELKSVNSRYFEYSSRLPRNCGFLDDTLKKAVSAGMSRGKVEIFLSIQNLEEGEAEVCPNLAMARGYYDALQAIGRDLRIDVEVNAAALGRYSDVFTVRRSEVDEEQLAADVLAVAQSAFNRFNEMRQAEGEKLCADIFARLDNLEQMLEQVEQDSAGRVQRYSDRLYARLAEVLQDRNVDEARLLTEAAIFADKTAVDEETVRLHSHVKQFREILEAEGPVGRKLDFLTQEVNRETNTIGSKCQEIEITRLVVDMKAEIEKIREQIQNLE